MVSLSRKVNHGAGRLARLAAYTVLAGMLVSVPAFGQDSSLGMDTGGEADADAGLQSATPTDNVNELNNNSAEPANNSAGDFGGAVGGGGGGANKNAGNGLNLDDEQGAEDDLFGEAAQGGENATGPNLNAPAGNGGVANPAANPTQPAAGGNAQSLMNQISGNPAVANPTAVNPAAANPAAVNPAATEPAATDPAASAPATGTEAMVPTAPAEPAITAPPLPPPNEFSGAPPVPGTIRQVAEGEAPEEYAVEPGDTLFDICDQLLDEPTYWPKLWAMNPDIKNPHFIFPGMRLKFYPGDDDSPPYLQVVTEDDVIPIDKGELEEQELIAEKVIFDEPVSAESEALEFVTLDQVEVPQEIVEMFEGSGSMYDGRATDVQLPGFIFGEEKEPLGVVVVGREGEQSVSEGQRVFIERTGDLGTGVHTVLRRQGGVPNPVTGDFVGYRYDFVANVKVERAAEIDQELMVGTVTASRFSVRPDDIVVPYTSTIRQLASVDGVGSLSSSDATLVGFSIHDQEIGGLYDMVFIDRGSSGGVSPGMYLPVYGTPGHLVLEYRLKDLPEDHEAVGVIKILDVTDVAAVGFVVKGTMEMRIGDRAGNGKG